MHQKYLISRDLSQQELKIREYAVIEKKPKRAAPSLPEAENYALLCEETYESEIVVNTISEGINALVAVLRTDNIFPIGPNATKIAESVMALYTTSEDGSVELFFDDLDCLPA